MDRGGAGQLRIIALGIETQTLPIAVEYAMTPLVENIVFVVGKKADRRVAPLPRHGGEPGLEIDGLQRGQPHRILGELWAFQSQIIGPGHLLEFKGAALADAALIGVRKTAEIEKHGF